MTVYDVFEKMVRTGYTEVDLILGSMLEDIMSLVHLELALADSTIGFNSLDFDCKSEAYSPEFYSVAWNAVIQPTVYEYLLRHKPRAWFIKFYEPNTVKGDV